MSDDTNPLEAAVERALEAFVYAPVGLLFEGPEVYPQLVEKGRNQITTARMMGEFAVQTGQAEARKVLEQRRGQLIETLGALGVPGFEPDAPEPAPKAPTKPAPRPKQRSATRTPPPDLAIPDYDSLSASQVVTRLAGLTADELEAVRRHEAGNRGRKTILNKVAQIQA